MATTITTTMAAATRRNRSTCVPLIFPNQAASPAQACGETLLRCGFATACRPLLIFVVPAHPVNRALLVSAQGGHVEQHVGADQRFRPARIDRIGVEYLARLIAIERAETGKLVMRIR